MGAALVFKAHRLLYHSTLGLRVIKKSKRSSAHGHDLSEGAVGTMLRLRGEASALLPSEARTLPPSGERGEASALPPSGEARGEARALPHPIRLRALPPSAGDEPASGEGLPRMAWCGMAGVGRVTRKVDVRLPGNGNSNSHGARPVHLIIMMIKWIRTSRLSTKNSLSGHLILAPAHHEALSPERA